MLATSEPPRELEPAGAREYSVMLVEDNPTDVFVICDILRNCGLNVRLRILRNGEEALRHVRELPPEESSSPIHRSLILLDLNLPRVGGIDVLREIKSSSQWAQVPVIVITSSTANADRQAAQRLGAAGYFQKPADLASYMDLAVLVRNVLKL